MDCTPGVQSFTYRTFAAEDIPPELADTPVETIELCHEHVTPESSDAEVAAVRATFADEGIDVCGYGVASVTDVETARRAVALVDRLGGEYLSVEFPPDADAVIGALVAAAAEHDVDLAIHNHGPGSTYATVADVLAVLDSHPDPRLGACVDTGHFLRAGQPPEEVVPSLGDRVHALHLKDFLDGDREAVPGEGALDLGDLIDLLAAETPFDYPLVVEYEADPADPTPAVRTAAEAVLDHCG